MSEVNASRGGVALKLHPTPTLVSLASTLPLQGRVSTELAARLTLTPPRIA